MDWPSLPPLDNHTIYAHTHAADPRAAAEQARRLRHLQGAEHGRLARRLAAALEQVADRAIHAWPDSRDGLRSAEHELAARGVTWDADPVQDRELARELEVARRRRVQRAPRPMSLPVGTETDRPLAA